MCARAPELERCFHNKFALAGHTLKWQEKRHSSYTDIRPFKFLTTGACSLFFVSLFYFELDGTGTDWNRLNCNPE